MPVPGRMNVHILALKQANRWHKVALIALTFCLDICNQTFVTFSSILGGTWLSRCFNYLNSITVTSLIHTANWATSLFPLRASGGLSSEFGWCESTTPYLERKDPRALSSAGPSPSAPLLRPKSSRTLPHQNCPTQGCGGRPEDEARLLGKRKNWIDQMHL